MKIYKFISIFLLSFVISFPAFALDLKQARTTGSVGETTTGYIAAIKKSPDVDALVNEVNIKRKQEYARISAENGQTIDIVGKVAAEQIILNLDSGTLYQGPDGSWKKR